MENRPGGGGGHYRAKTHSGESLCIVDWGGEGGRSHQFHYNNYCAGPPIGGNIKLRGVM